MVVQEIRCFKITVRSAIAGQTCSLAISVQDKVDVVELFNSIKRGSIMTDRTDPPSLISEFVVKLGLCNTSEETIVRANYEPVVFSETFKQSCCIEVHNKSTLKLTKAISKSKDTLEVRSKVNKKRSDSYYMDNSDWTKLLRQSAADICLKPNADNLVLLRFKFRPEYVRLGQRIVIYDQHLKATGEVVELVN